MDIHLLAASEIDEVQDGLRDLGCPRVHVDRHALDVEPKDRVRSATRVVHHC